jgi:hypothetical protein
MAVASPTLCTEPHSLFTMGRVPGPAQVWTLLSKMTATIYNPTSDMRKLPSKHFPLV